MFRGTTPYLQLIVDKRQITEATVYITITDDRAKESQTWKSGDPAVDIVYRYPDTYVYLALTQEQTLAFSCGSLRAQIRWIDAEGKAWATEEAKLVVKDVLLKEVITYE